tara:strand:+ start:52 stop:270 length:219 start_codon:yes stop_codon:yes gene_type:complete
MKRGRSGLARSRSGDSDFRSNRIFASSKVPPDKSEKVKVAKRIASCRLLLLPGDSEYGFYYLNLIYLQSAMH